MVVRVAYDPVGAFDRMRNGDTFRLAILLLLIRWAVTPVNTVLGMYRHDSPMLLSPLFGLSESSYRFYEILWYGPFGVLVMLTIVSVLFLTARRFLHIPAVSWRKTCEIVSLSFFTPWMPSVPGDWLLITAVNARPEFLVPFHLAILSWECILVSIGFRCIYKMDWFRCALLGLAAACLFLAMGGLVIR